MIIYNEQIILLEVVLKIYTFASYMAVLTKDITPTQYAKWRKCSLSNIIKQIKYNRELPQVLEVKRFGRFYLLNVPISMNASTFRKRATLLQK